MSRLILPDSYKARSKLQEHLRTRDQKDFEDTVALTAEFVVGLERVAKARRMRNTDTLRALVSTLVSAVHAKVPHTEWSDVADILCEELRARLTVEQD